MKKVIIVTSMLLLAFILNAQDQSKSDFPLTEDKEARKSSSKPIPDTYIIFFDDAELQPYILKNPPKENEDRATRGNSAKSHENQLIVAIRKLAQDKLDITPAMISEYYTTATVGIKVQIKNTNTKGLADKLKVVKEVGAIVQDFEITATYFEDPKEKDLSYMQFAQYPSWGLSRVGYGNYTGSKWAWVLDTGIDPTHPDLNVLTNSTFAVSFISGETTVDGNGHGTHVAGIIAAKNNTIGTLGVAAGATVVPVKVLSNAGPGAWSALLSGLNHVAKYAIPGDVVNMSLGGPAPAWYVFDARKFAENAIVNLGNSGVFCVIAAGNDASNATNQTPARTNGNRVYTISAHDWNNALASFSNYGNPPIDYSAPGESISSTYKDGGYKILSGTSMAAPFVSGILLINNGTIYINGVLNTDKDSTKDYVAKK